MVNTSKSYLCDLYTGQPHWDIVSYLWEPVGQHLSQHSGKCVFAEYISNCIVIQGVFMLRPVRWKSNAFIYFSTSCSMTQLLFVAVSKGVGLMRRCKRQTHVITTDVFSCRNKVMWRWQEIKTRGNITTLRPGGLAWCWWFWGRPLCLCPTRLHRSLS